MPILWIKELGKQFAYEITEGVRSRGSADFSALTTGIPGGLGGSTLVSLGLLVHLLGSWFSAVPPGKSQVGFLNLRELDRHTDILIYQDWTRAEESAFPVSPQEELVFYHTFE